MSSPFDIAVHVLWFECEALSPIHLMAGAGGQIRGALWEALSRLTCPDPKARGVPEHNAHCPLCRLMHLETVSPRGVNPARPFAVRPPLTRRAEEPHTYEPGHVFRFGINLFGSGADTIPYIVQAVYRLGAAGIGKGRGRFHLNSVREENPFIGIERLLYKEGGQMQPPSPPLTAADVCAAAELHLSDVVTLRFITPTQLIEKGKPLDHPQPQPLIARLLERCQSLETMYTTEQSDPAIWRTRHFEMIAASEAVQVARDDTRWVDVWSSSVRTGYRDNIGGFVGAITLKGNLEKLRYWLTYGQLLHIGKNAVKGSGWYEILHH